ncbi:hypothetical protein M2137_000891 [Parabacteroides sp. PFB2-10]|nr:hypothetical protein [Parabacteroides sp. PFB2-10]
MTAVKEMADKGNLFGKGLVGFYQGGVSVTCNLVSHERILTFYYWQNR